MEKQKTPAMTVGFKKKKERKYFIFNLENWSQQCRSRL